MIRTVSEVNGASGKERKGVNCLSLAPIQPWRRVRQGSKLPSEALQASKPSMNYWMSSTRREHQEIEVEGGEWEGQVRTLSILAATQL